MAHRRPRSVEGAALAAASQSGALVADPETGPSDIMAERVPVSLADAQAELLRWSDQDPRPISAVMRRAVTRLLRALDSSTLTDAAPTQETTTDETTTPQARRTTREA